MSVARPEIVRALARRRRRGFSLVELMVALIGGLIVGLAVVGISTDATNTLHEEVRIAGAENALRVAVERLRADLQRASYMSTPNIQSDPMIARKIGGDNLSNQTAGSAGAPAVLKNLAGVRLHSGAAASNAIPPTSYQGAAFLPDSIDIGGNFSSSDEYAGYLCTAAAGGGCTASICLEMNTPSMWRIRNQPTAATATSATALAALQAAFQPGGAAQFMVRITDPSGHFQYALTCPGAGNPVTGSITTGFQVNLAGTTLLTPKDTGGQGGVGGLSAGLLVISPVEVVHWDLLCSPSNAACPAAAQLPVAGFLYGATANLDPNEFFLTRGYIDAASATGATDPNTTEVVAEYATDLKFGFTVDTSTPQAPGTQPAPGAYTTNPLQAYAVDQDAQNAPWAGAVWGASKTPNTVWTPAAGALGIQGTPEPQRIRSIRARVGVRSPFADRSLTIAPPIANGKYMYRYQLLPTASTTALKWARVRESITEVTLPNQSRFFW